ncbi:serine hydrolase [Tahibacter harae]|uniref:Serine hydrolase n=1 Tax=Tahibacter harae TaxID=2963937 RepID=A0ABT1QKS2_9GAMM|nr:serine hydrolase [Tahibacter harae]MCQ4163135.1 serine hydrolase [Tahibacter harae]
MLRVVTVAEMSATLYPVSDPGTYYGLGLMVFDIDDAGRCNLWLGDAGGTPGAGVLVIYSPEDEAFVVVALTGDGPAPAAVNALLKATTAENPDRPARQLRAFTAKATHRAH